MTMWLAKHKKTTVLLWNILVWIPVVMLFDMVPQSRSIWWILYGAFMFLFSLVWADSIRLQALKNAEKVNNDTCDPHVLLDTVNELLPLIKSKSQKFLFYLDMSCALMQLGKFEDALRIIKENDVDTCGGVMPTVRFIYYNNLAYAYLKLEQLDLVPYLIEKSKRILDNIKMKPEIRSKLNSTFQTTLSEFRFYQNDLDEAYEILTKIDYVDKSRMHQVNFKLLMAKILIGKDRSEEAIPYLRFVLEFGNKLYDVIEANQILEQMDKNGSV